MFDFAMRSLAVSTLYRSHRAQRDPLVASLNSDFRFNAPAPDRASGRTFGVLYLARQPAGAYIETVSDGKNRIISESWARQMALAELACESMEVVDLTAEGLARLDLDARLTCGVGPDDQRYSASQHFAREVYDKSEADGILYRARHDPSCLSLAIFDRALPRLRLVRTTGWLDEPHRFLRWLERYGHCLGP